MNSYVYVSNNPVSFVDPFGTVCGSKGIDWVIPDAPGNFDFTSCCQGHDDFYSGECGYKDYSKDDCDESFYDCMIKKCNSVHGGQDCYMWAGIYYKAVRKWGGSRYKRTDRSK